MKRKSLLIVLFSLFVYFSMIMTSQAAQQLYTCKYSSDDPKITIKFNLSLKI